MKAIPVRESSYTWSRTTSIKYISIATVTAIVIVVIVVGSMCGATDRCSRGPTSTNKHRPTPDQLQHMCISTAPVMPQPNKAKVFNYVVTVLLEMEYVTI